MAKPTPKNRIIPYPPAPIPDILLGGSVNMFAGASGVGKTAFLAGFTKKLAENQLIFGRQPNPIPTIAVLSIDRSWEQSSQLWYKLAGWEDIPHYCLQDDFEFNIAMLGNKHKRMEILEMCLKKVEPLPYGSLVIVDPVAPFLGGNLMDYDACMVACTRLRRICRTRGITMIGVAHASKQKADKKEQYLRLQDRIVGTTAQFGYTDTQMYLASPLETGQPHYTFLWHPHHAPAETFNLGRAKNGLFVDWGEGVREQEESAVMANVPTTEEGIGFGDLVIASGVGKSTVHRVLTEGQRAGTILKVGHGMYRRAPVN